MKTQSDFTILEKKAGVLFIQDLNLGRRSVTNDAEQVLEWCREHHGKNIRVVYRDSENEWSEIVDNVETWMGKGIGFKPWYGLDWDILKR